MKDAEKKRLIKIMTYGNSNTQKEIGDLEHYINSLYREFAGRKISSASKVVRKTGIWEKQGDRVFITCNECGVIAELTGGHSVTKSGYVTLSRSSESMGCITCKRCGHHFFPILVGWEERERKSFK